MAIDQLIEDFELLDDWEERYRYVIELGKQLEPLPDALRVPATKVEGCASQVWLVSQLRTGDDETQRLHFIGDSDAHIVRGLIAVLFAIVSDQTPQNILTADPQSIFSRIGLKDHLTPQRSNGLAAMIARIRHDAEAALSTAQQ